MPDLRLDPLRDKDAVISTYHADSLVQSPGVVDVVYTGHANTHISMGDTSTFQEKLIHWTRHNKGCVIGAIVGPYGYGKTSTAVHLWRECEKNNVIAVPPFAWFHLPHLIDATYAWVAYRLGQIAPGRYADLEEIHQRYRNQSLEALATARGVPVETLAGLLQDGLLKLECRPGDVVRFLAEVSALLAQVGREGPVVFTDELQLTLSEYPTREQFMEELFGLLNELHQRQGSYGLVIGMPTATEALINDVRGDIIHRMQSFNVYLRPEVLYTRQFAEQLWRKFAQLFGFTDIMSQILPPTTLKSIGQIAARKDLGAGPRTVVDAFRRAITSYDETDTPYLPFDLINDYLNDKVAFDQSGKLAIVVREALGARPVLGDADKEDAIKLLAAFPEGCPDEIQHEYDLADVISDLPPAYRREYVYEFVEGPSLRKLAATEVKSDPVFVRLTKEFIGRYKEDERHVEMALAAFQNLLLKGVIFHERRGTSLTGWKWEDATTLGGSFSERYPDRRLYLEVAAHLADLKLDRQVDELGLWIVLDAAAGAQDLGEVRRLGSATRTLMRVNATIRPSGMLPIAYLNDLGVSASKLSPLFMLALLQHLETNRSAIPNDEQDRAMRTFTEQLLSHAARLLFNDELRQISDWSVARIGPDMVKDVLNQMCETAYPGYTTFITMRGWEQHVNLYISALKNPRITLPVAHGQQVLAAAQEEIVQLFAQRGSQGFQNLVQTISYLLERVSWTGRDRGEIRLKLHPLEQLIRDALDTSAKKVVYRGSAVGALTPDEITQRGRRHGYLPVEVEYAIRLLEARRYLTLDSRTRSLVQLIESPEERRALLTEKLEAIREILKTLSAQVPDFNVEKYSAQVGALARKIERATDVQQLESFSAEGIRLRNDLDSQIQVAISRHQDSLTQLVETIRRAIRDNNLAPLDAVEVSRLPWGRYLSAIWKEIQISLQSAMQLANELIARGETIRREAETAASPANRLVTLYRGQVELKKLQPRAEEQIKETDRYVKQWAEWRPLPELAARVAREVENCANTYQMPGFRDDFARIENNLTIGITAGQALNLAPSLRTDLEKLERAAREWIAGQRDQFMAAKQTREEILARLSGRPAPLRAGFDHYHPLDSYRNLEAEVQDQLDRLTNAVLQRLDRLQGDLAYLQLILDGQSRERIPDFRAVEAAMAGLLRPLTSSGATDTVSLESRAAAIAAGQAQADTLHAQISGLLVKQNPTAAEASILDILPAGQTLELGELVRALAQRQGAEHFSLGQLMTDIESLFQKNQVIIKLERR
jgi:hypothetical protein